MNNRISINEVLATSGLSNNYVRKSIANGKLPSTLEKMEGRETMKRWIEVSDYEAWRSSISGSKRDDGRNKFVIYMTPDEELQVRAMLAETEVVNTIVRANLKSVDVEVTE